jgi:hypothetical protein
MDPASEKEGARHAIAMTASNRIAFRYRNVGLDIVGQMSPLCQVAAARVR